MTRVKIHTKTAQQRTAQGVSRSFDRRLAAYSLAGGAALALATPAQAGIVSYTYTANNTMNYGDPNLPLNINGVTADLSWSNNGFNNVLAIVPSNSSSMSILVDGDSLALGGGSTIDALGSYNAGATNLQKWNPTSGAAGTGNWAGQNAYLGLQLTFTDTTTHYGYLQLSVPSLGSGTVSVEGWAYESVADTAIKTPTAAVPEPSSLAMLTAGAVGLAAWRQQRKVKNRGEMKEGLR